MANKKKKRSFGKTLGSGAAGSVGYDLLLNKGQGVLDFTQALLPFMFKDGGRVRGCGIAKRGFGKAMKGKKR
tara:strand:+ start:84 stop:299 length:216 start_codon:yes stop_codon:yes gene_type:complete